MSASATREHREPGCRDAILDAVAGVLARKKGAANEMQEVVEQSGISFADVEAEFENTDDILLALISRVAEGVVRPLASEGGDVEAVLTEFGSNVQEAFSTVLVGAIRVFMTESLRRKALRGRFNEAGPGAISAALARYIELAADRGALEVGDAALAAEHLMGMLREPLYLELALQSDEAGGASASPDAFRAAVRTFLDGYGVGGERRHG